jgi:hypothetical protein
MSKIIDKSQLENSTDILLVQKDIEYIKFQLETINEKLDNEYVTRTEFAPIQKLVYGGVSLTLVAVVTALLALVITK